MFKLSDDNYVSNYDHIKISIINTNEEKLKSFNNSNLIYIRDGIEVSDTNTQTKVIPNSSSYIDINIDFIIKDLYPGFSDQMKKMMTSTLAESGVHYDYEDYF
jgi:hypothetical protein